MKVTIHANSQAPIGILIERLLVHADDVFIASAYVSAKAISTLSARMQQRDASKFNIDILFGLDAETDLEAVQKVYDAALEMPDCLHVRYTPHHAGRLFHPKVYYFRRRSTCHILIASANLTEAGHHANEEMYCYIEVPETHDVVAQFNTVRQVWWSEPFSAELDDQVVGAKAGIEYQRQQLKQAEETFGRIISDVGRGKVPLLLPPEDILAPLRTELANGYLITPSFSLSYLYVSIQDILKPVEDTKPVKENQIIKVQNRLSASVSLLPDDVIKDFSNLQQSARDLCETYSVPTASGLYVPLSAHPTLSRKIKELERKHSKLISSNIKNKSVINKHLKDKLESECRLVWQTLNPDATVPFPGNLLPEVEKRVKERRVLLQANPSELLRFSFQAYPHPLVLMNQMPGQLAWQLQKGDPDQELIHIIIALLRGQVNLIQGVTQWSKPSIIKRDYERVRLLVAIKSKSTDALLRSLSAWVRERQTITRGQTPDQKKQQLAKKAKVVKTKAEEHLNWLANIGNLEHKEMVTRLLEEYYSLQ